MVNNQSGWSRPQNLNESSPWTLREFLKFLKRLFAPRYMCLLITLYLTPTPENRIFPIYKKMCINWTFLGWECSVSRWTELTLSLPTSMCQTGLTTKDNGWEWNPFLVAEVSGPAHIFSCAPWLPWVLQGLRSGLSRSLLEPRQGCEHQLYSESWDGGRGRAAIVMTLVGFSITRYWAFKDHT